MYKAIAKRTFHATKPESNERKYSKRIIYKSEPCVESQSVNARYAALDTSTNIKSHT